MASIFSPVINSVLESVAEPIGEYYKFYKSWHDFLTKPLPKPSIRRNPYIINQFKKHSMSYYRNNRSYRRFKGYRRPRTSYGRGKSRYGNKPMYKKRYYRKRYSTYTKKTSQSSLRSNSGSKMQDKVNYLRKNIGLPPMQINYVNEFNPLDTANQWLAYAAGQFNLTLFPHAIAEGENDLNAREGETLRILPFTLKFHMRQARDITYSYRIILVKFMPKNPELQTTMATPQNILRETTTITDALYSPYVTIKEGRETYPFKVLYDNRFEISSYGSDNNIRHYSIKFPAANVIYDENDQTGDMARNAICLCVLTSAPATSADYYFGYEGQVKFLDLN